MTTSPWLATQDQAEIQPFGVCWLAGDCPHAGIDVAAPAGTPIVDQIAGVIQDVLSSGGYGMHQVLDIGGGRSLLFGHESSWAVGSGTAVKPGDVIGYVGSTGYSTGPHVHFEEDIGGRPVDPSVALWTPGSIGGDVPVISGLQQAAGAATSGAQSAVAGAIAGIPTQVGHGIADFFAIGLKDAATFLNRQIIALAVAAIVLLVLFA